MSRDTLPNGAIITGFPRVSGDEPRLLVTCVLSNRFSPRERG